MKTIIIHSQDLSLAQRLSLSLKGELEQRKKHFRIHTSNNFNLTHLRELNKVDLNLISETFNFSEVRLLVSDMDSTLITIETIDEIAKVVGMSNEVTEITEQAMLGNLDFTESFKKRVSILSGINISSFENVYNNHLQLSPGVPELIKSFKSLGIKSAIVSGGLVYFAERLKSQLGLDTFQANNVEINNNCLTGKVLGKVIDASEKANYIYELCELYQLETDQVIAIGDGANDLEMMKIAGISVAYRAKPVLEEKCDIVINYSGLDSVLDFFDYDS
jgi:phosphoserine phosphatase